MRVFLHMGNRERQHQTGHRSDRAPPGHDAVPPLRPASTYRREGMLPDGRIK